MKVCVVIFVLYLLTSEQVLAQSSKAAKSAKSAKCPKDLACNKLNADCTVTVEDFKTQSRTMSAPQVFNLTINANTECGIELNEVSEGPRIDTFCSQNLTQYHVGYICVAKSSEGICTSWYIALRIPDTRPGGVGIPDLSNLPWKQIYQDWYKFISAYFPDAPFPSDTWNGDECGFLP